MSWIKFVFLFNRLLLWRFSRFLCGDINDFTYLLNYLDVHMDTSSVGNMRVPVVGCICELLYPDTQNDMLKEQM